MVMVDPGGREADWCSWNAHEVPWTPPPMTTMLRAAFESSSALFLLDDAALIIFVATRGENGVKNADVPATDESRAQQMCFIIVCTYCSLSPGCVQ